MLIDIEKYVRQLLPPNRREPIHIGLATLLFAPIMGVVDAYNDYKYDSQFDTGTPGQTAVLEYILQSYVHPNCILLEGDGVYVDFRVLVPSPSLYGKARQVVDRYRLASKRYSVGDVVSWGADGALTLAWLVNSPRISAAATPGVWELSMGINEAGLFPVRVVNQTTGKVWVDTQIQFSGLGSINVNVDEAGSYRITVGPLAAIKSTEASEPEPGQVCDLVWLDQHPGNNTDLALSSRWSDGVRQIYLSLYSIRFNLQPFVTRIFQGGNLVHIFDWNNPQGQWHTIPSLATGTYEVDVADKYGCLTSRRQISLYDAPSAALSLSSVQVQQTNGVYGLTVQFAGGTSPYTVSVRKLDNSLLYSINILNSPYSFNLPGDTAAQTVKVRVTDSLSAQAEQNIDLGSGAPSTAATYRGKTVITNNGKQYTYSKTPDIDLAFTGDGKARLVLASSTKGSANGQKTCIPYLFVNESAPSQAYVDDILGATGRHLLPGKTYAFNIAWLPQDIITSYNDLNDNTKIEQTNLIDQGYYLNSAGQDYLYVTVLNV